MKITVRFNCGTYCATAEGWNVRATATMGAQVAAQRAAAKAFNLDVDQVVVQLSGGSTTETWFTAKPISQPRKDHANMSFDQLFREVFGEQRPH